MAFVNANDIFGIAQGFEPKRQYRWVFTIDGIDSWAAKTFQRPSRTFEEIALDYINSKRWLAGKHTWNDISLVLYDPVSPSAAAKVQEWCRRNYDNATGRAGYSAFYKKNITLQMLDPLGNIVETWTLEGAWPREVQYGDLDYASSEAVNISLTIRYDRATLENSFTAIDLDKNTSLDPSGLDLGR